jgi:hypothetical protein
VIGCEVNAAAWHFARIAAIAGSDVAAKETARRRLLELQQKFAGGPLFADNGELAAQMRDEVRAEPDDENRCVLAAVFLLAMGNGSAISAAALRRACTTMLDLLLESSEWRGRARCLLNDARQMRLPDESVDAIITSPPYINVFNYHQNFRPGAESLGWRPLEAARSEIGANRKHRMNRFLTVVQYCLDMAQSLNEASRVLRSGSPLIVVLGRTSSVLGGSFKNGEIIRKLLGASNAFEEIGAAERVFVSRFGERIFEDLVIAERRCFAHIDEGAARAVAVSALQEAIPGVPQKNLRALQSAIELGDTVQASPLLDIEAPAAFQGLID